MKKVILAIALLTALLIIVSIFSEAKNTKPITQNENMESVVILETKPTFEWRFEKADTTNPDGNPQIRIFLVISLPGDSSEILIDTVDGGCSELVGEKHEGDISNTGKAQCYYAGFGQYYRITQKDDAYAIERKFFEEATPGTVSPDYEWEVIKEVSRTQE